MTGIKGISGFKGGLRHGLSVLPRSFFIEVKKRPQRARKSRLPLDKRQAAVENFVICSQRKTGSNRRCVAAGRTGM